MGVVYSSWNKDMLLNAGALGAECLTFEDGQTEAITDALKRIALAEEALGIMPNTDLVTMAKLCFDRTEGNMSKELPAGVQMTKMVDCLDALALQLAHRLAQSEKALNDLRKQLGWTLCTEELPKKAGYYRVTVVYRRGKAEYMRMTAKRRFCDNGRWHGSCEAREVIAWQEDEPYTGGAHVENK